MSEKIILSGIKPTGMLTLGNYLGAIKNFINLQNEYKDATLYIFIADLHATTMPIDPVELKNNIRCIAATFIASGLNLEKCNIFVQSDVLEHANLGFLMESTVYSGELERMIQFKEKSKTSKGEGIRASLLTYPALMAADILLYNPDFIPIGEDQMQHIELTNILADRFNKRYGQTFKIPKAILNKNAKKIMSLQDPLKKMSKSGNNPKGYILLNDSKEEIVKKIKSAVTDSDNKIKYDVINKPAISNLLNILASLKGVDIPLLEKSFLNKTYKDLKEEITNSLLDEIIPLQNKINNLLNGKIIDEVLENGKNNAKIIASKTLSLAKKNMGLGK